MKFFAGKRKKTLIFGFLLLALGILFGLGLKYLPVNKIFNFRLTSGSDTASIQVSPGIAPHSFVLDFEVVPGRKPTGKLYNEKAHSGKYSSKAFGKNSHAIAIEKKVEEIGTENLKSVGLSTWVYVFPNNREVKGSMVFSASNELGVNICWKDINLSGPEIPRGIWFKISGNLDLSNVKFKAGDKVQIYFWNNSSTDILVDDYFIVFHGSDEKRGDHPALDLTGNTPAKTEFNRPPFPTIFLDKVQTGTQDSLFMVMNDKNKTEMTDPDVQIVTGNFLGTYDGLDNILVLNRENRFELYTFCRKEKTFMSTEIETPPGNLMPRKVLGMWAARFVRNAGEQLLIRSKAEWILGKFGQVRKPCGQGNSAKTKLTVLWRSSVSAFGITNTDETSILNIGDYDGDQLSEVLIIKGEGSWQLFKTSSTSPVQIRQIASGNLFTSLNRKNIKFAIFSGKFLPRLKQEVILTVFLSPEKKKPVYSLSRFNQSEGLFEPVIRDSDKNLGKTIGCDTLHLSDKFLTGNFKQSGESGVLRYDRSWRFDLKEIRFNDTTFQILNNIDFTGYTGDHNPKYYEEVRLFPGHFIDPSVSSLLVIGRNRKVTGHGKPEGSGSTGNMGFPEFISLYTFERENKNHQGR